MQKKPSIGVLCYDLTPASTSILEKISRSAGDYSVRAFPIYGPSPKPEEYNFTFRPSQKNPRTIVLNNLSGNAPEVQIRTIGFMIAFILTKESDVVCLLGLQGIPAVLTALFGYLRKKPILAISQTMNPVAERNRPAIIRWLKSFVLGLATCHIAQTPNTMDTLLMNYRIPADRTTFIPWDGGASDFAEIMKKHESISRKIDRVTFGLAESTTTILFCGTLFYLKGVDVLIRAFAEMLASFPDSVLLIVGPDGGKSGNAQQLKILADSLNVRAKVRFFGPQPRENLAQFYIASDIFVLPTRKDVWPKVLVEAGMAGLPLITTEVCGGAGYLVQEKKNGFIVPSDDVASLASALLKLCDENTRLEYGKASKEIMAEYMRPHRENRLYHDAILRCSASFKEKIPE